ncbi:MAG: hypothetical protein AB1806_11730 [Acidobacteriota bacterium]
MRALSADLSDPAARPYFLWDEDISVAELRAALKAGRNEHERLRLLGKLLREARDSDVWRFVTPSDVAAALPVLGRRLGRRRRFWEFLIEGWQRDGLLGR